jgi:hypothetical protein
VSVGKLLILLTSATAVSITALVWALLDGRYLMQHLTTVGEAECDCICCERGARRDSGDKPSLDLRHLYESDNAEAHDNKIQGEEDVTILLSVCVQYRTDGNTDTLSRVTLRVWYDK